MPDRGPLELLHPHDRVTLEHLCRRLGVAPHGWRRVSWLRVLFETLAVEAEADRIQGENGCGRMSALELACIRAGVGLEAHRSRLQRAVRDSTDRYREPDENCGKMHHGSGAVRA